MGSAAKIDRLPFDSERYKDRKVIERLFGRIKECRRVATRYEKYAWTYLSMAPTVNTGFP